MLPVMALGFLVFTGITNYGIFILAVMTYYQVVISGSSVLIGTVIGWARYKKIDNSALPFIICLTVASANEIISFMMTLNRCDTAYNNNIYVLLEALLIVWQFRKWQLLNRYSYLFPVIMLAIVIAWIIENVLFAGSASIKSYCRIFYALVIVLMSIHVNNELILTFKKKLFKSPVFLICAGFIIYFTFKILVESFWLYGLSASKSFRNNVYLMLVWINLFVNLIYAFALLWMPRRPQYIKLC